MSSRATPTPPQPDAPNDNVTALAAAWISLYRGNPGPGERDPCFWAYEKLSDKLRDAPEDAWMVIQAIASATDAEDVLANLAAGPLEDLLASHGPRFIDRIEAAAVRDPRFRKLLGAVWRNAIAEDVWKRISAVAGPSW